MTNFTVITDDDINALAANCEYPFNIERIRTRSLLHTKLDLFDCLT